MKFKVGRTGIFLLTLLLLGLAGLLPGYVPIRYGAAGVRLTVPASRFPLLFQVNDKTAQGTANVSSGSDVLGAIRASMSAWESIQTAAVRFADLQITSLESADSSDGMSLITMADTPANAQLMGPGTLGLTRLIFDPGTGVIHESDMILNPGVSFSTNLSPDTYDVQAVVTHELGHALGCDHAVAQNDTMFYTADKGEFFPRFLSVDDAAFATFTYPNPARSAMVGSITGRVTMSGLVLGGGGALGTSVTAMDLDRNLIYTALADSDGRYALTGPIPGRYAFYVEPLNGPVGLAQLLGGGGDSYYKNTNTSFLTTFLTDQNLPGLVPRSEVNFSVPSGAPTLNIDKMGRNDPATGALYVGGGAAVVHPGESLTLIVGGADTWKVASLDDVSILGTGISIDPSRPLGMIKTASGTNVGIGFNVNVAPDAKPGPRTVRLRLGDQVAASTGGIVVGMRTIPQRSLYLPYLFSSSEQYTGIALANPAGTPAVVRISARDNKGDLIYDTNALVPADLSIAGGAQIARLEREIFNLPTGSQQSGSIIVESDSQSLQGFFLTGDGSTFLDGAEAFTRAYKELYFADILQNPDTSTEIHLMNVKDVPVSVQLSLVGSGGQPLRPALTRVIPARGKIGESVASIFGTGEILSSAHVRAVTANEALAGFTFIRQSDTVFGVNALPSENAASLLYSPQLAAGNFGGLNVGTRINIVNVGDSPATVSVTVLGDGGQVIATPRNPQPALVPAGGHLTLDALSYFGFTSPTVGSVRIVGSGGARLLGNVLFGDGDPTQNRLSFGAALPLSSAGSSAFLFSQVAQALGFYTGVAFFAPEGAELKVEVFREDGSLSGSQTASLVPGGRLVKLLQELIPATRGQVKGFVKVTANKPVIAFELFGATDGKFLSAVPPQSLN